jgi:hypothetical protein
MDHVDLNPIFFELWTKLSCTKLFWTLLPRALNCSRHCSRELLLYSILYVVLAHTAMLCCPYSPGVLDHAADYHTALDHVALYGLSLSTISLLWLFSSLSLRLSSCFFSYVSSHMTLVCLSPSVFLFYFFPSVSLPLAPSVSLSVSLVHYFSPVLSPYVSKSLFLHLPSPPFSLLPPLVSPNCYQVPMGGSVSGMRTIIQITPIILSTADTK